MAQDCFSALRKGENPFDKKIIRERTEGVFTAAGLGKEYINRYAKRSFSFPFHILLHKLHLEQPQVGVCQEE